MKNAIRFSSFWMPKDDNSSLSMKPTRKIWSSQHKLYSTFVVSVKHKIERSMSHIYIYHLLFIYGQMKMSFIKSRRQKACRQRAERMNEWLYQNAVYSASANTPISSSLLMTMTEIGCFQVKCTPEIKSNCVRRDSPLKYHYARFTYLICKYKSNRIPSHAEKKYECWEFTVNLYCRVIHDEMFNCHTNREMSVDAGGFYDLCYAKIPFFSSLHWCVCVCVWFIADDNVLIHKMHHL